MKYSVYMWENTINNKKYIGITKRNPEVRWEEWKRGLYNKYLIRAIKKYGIDKFNRTVILADLEKEEACRVEQELISKFHSNNKEFGYNITAGGETNNRTGTKHTEEAKQKIREAHLGMVASKETRDKMRESRIERNLKNPPIPLEDIIKIRERKLVGEKRRNVFSDYSSQISLSAFRGIWDNRTFKEVK